MTTGNDREKAVINPPEKRRKIASIERRVDNIDVRVGSSPATERIRGWKLVKIRSRILLRDGYTCQVCKRVSVDLEIDHIVPLHMGGGESDANRQALCGDCHRAKSAREEKDRGLSKSLEPYART